MYLYTNPLRVLGAARFFAARAGALAVDSAQIGVGGAEFSFRGPSSQRVSFRMMRTERRGGRNQPARTRARSAAVLCAIAVLGLIGCAHNDYKPAVPPPTTLPASEGLSTPAFIARIGAYAVPPAGWRLDADGGDDKHRHLVWVSPSGHTAYGVLFFKLPFPVGHDLALEYGYLPEMKRQTGEANLRSKRWDPEIEAIRFVVDGGLYQLQASFFIRGTQGWAVYVGTKRDSPLESGEVRVAEKARENTVVNAPAPPATQSSSGSE